MTLDELIDRRNEVQLKAEDTPHAASCWTRLGVASRHIERCATGMPLSPGVEREIIRCINDAAEWLESL